MKRIDVAVTPLRPTTKIKWPIRLKITMPYFALGIIVILSVAMLFWRIMLETVDERFNNQLYEAGVLSSDAMARIGLQQVETLRLLSNIDGVDIAIQENNPENLRRLAFGLAVNNQVSTVEYLDPTGNLILAIRESQNSDPKAYEFVQGGAPIFKDWSIVQKVLTNPNDSTQKFSNIIQTDWGTYFYTCGPVKNELGQLTGIILVGTPLSEIARSLREATLAQITLYDLNGLPISSSFPENSNLRSIDESLVQDILNRQDTASYRRDLISQDGSGSNLEYGEIIGSWKSNTGDDLGLIGTFLVKNVLITATMPTRIWLALMVALTVLLIFTIGYNVSSIITRPLTRLMHATQSVASGELQVFVAKETNDEIAALADSFNVMIKNLQHTHNEMVNNYDRTLEGWAKILEMRDKETSGHSNRVMELTMSLAPQMGISPDQFDQLRRGVLLHDIGKLGVPDAILLKPSPLNEVEWFVMRKHPEYAYEMLKNIPYLSEASEVPYCHHEHWDGKGYPRQLMGESIPLTARVFALVDAWDAITTDRPYRKKLSPKEALFEIQMQSGKQFDPELVEKFSRYIESAYLGMT